MDPFQINAAYRQQQLLDEANAEALARSTRTARPGLLSAASGLLGWIARATGQLRGGKPVTASRKASI